MMMMKNYRMAQCTMSDEIEQEVIVHELLSDLMMMIGIIIEWHFAPCLVNERLDDQQKHSVVAIQATTC